MVTIGVHLAEVIAKIKRLLTFLRQSVFDHAVNLMAQPDTYRLAYKEYYRSIMPIIWKILFGLRSQ